jgi:hypothetical protein
MNKLPSIYLMFDTMWYQMSPSDYAFDGSEYQDGSICALAIMGNGQDFMLTGNSFLRGYYSIHDMHDGYIGMAPHSNSQKHWIEVGEVPTQIMQ